MSASTEVDVPISGFVADGFESVLAELGENTADLAQAGTAFTAYFQGQLVVDIWAGYARPGEEWTRDTLNVLVSSSKGLGTACLMLLVERGLIALDTPVSQCWPEFASKGKERITVRNVLMHTSGVVTLPDHETVIDRTWDGTGFEDIEEIGHRLATAAPSWDPGTAHGYHALTYGWLLDHIIRRVDGRTIGGFFAEEIAQPWRLDLWIGTPLEEHYRVAQLSPLAQLPPDASETQKERRNRWNDPDTFQGQAWLASHADGDNIVAHLHELLTSPKMLQAEFASANATGTAAALARCYAGMAAGGVLDDIRLFSPETINTFRTSTGRRPDHIVGEMEWMLGFHPIQLGQPAGSRSPLAPGAEAFGHAGAGGQIGVADPNAQVAIGFVCTASNPTRFGSLARRVYDCVG